MAAALVGVWAGPGCISAMCWLLVIFIDIAMKQQLTRFRTQLDKRANFNKDKLFEAQKEVYGEEIGIYKGLDSRTADQFTLRPLEIGFVSSLTLKDDPKFILIQKTFEKYNEEVLALRQNPQEGLHLKKVVMESMLKFMRIMLLAPGIESKKTILDLSYFWFIKHLHPKSQRKSPQQLSSQIRQIVTQHQLVPQALLEKELPSHHVAADLWEYRRGARTQHPELDAPEAELQKYQVHKVTYMGQLSDPPQTDAQRWKRKLLQVKYEKPNLDQYYIEEEPKEIQIDVPIVQATDQNQPLQPQPEEGVPGEAPAENIPENQELAKQMELLNQMGGEPDQPEEVVVEEGDKKRGKLDPLVKIFMRKQLDEKERREAFEHPPINQLERYRNNYKEAVQREDQHFSRYMSDWAAKRGRFKTEVARKVQSIRINPNQTAALSPATDFDHSFTKTRVNEAIRDGRNYVKGELSRERLNTQGGLSCFDKRRVKTVTAASANKTFSHILEENRRVNQREERLAQIESIKQKFSKHKIFTSMQAMKGGLMQEEEGEEEAARVEYPVCLLSNPFFVGKKKKKKTKKRR